MELPICFNLSLLIIIKAPLSFSIYKSSVISRLYNIPPPSVLLGSPLLSVTGVINLTLPILYILSFLSRPLPLISIAFRVFLIIFLPSIGVSGG